MNNPQQLKERIYALNPELKALTTGCKIETTRMKYEGETYTVIGYKVVNKCGVYDQLLCNMEGRTTTVKFGNVYDKNGELDFKFEILGHPITLNALLIAIEKSKGTVSIDTIGDWYDDDWNEVGTRYDLTKTFDQNIAENEELVTFLLSIIK